jgi:hypothetical protein
LRRSRRRIPLALLLPGLIGAWSCAARQHSRGCVTFRQVDPPPEGAIQVTFLGVGGVLIRRGTDAILTAPLYSNPTFGELALWPIHSDGERIQKLLHQDVRDVAAILVGHSHYDHLLDLPFVALRMASRADIYANDTAKKLLHPLERELSARTPPNAIVDVATIDACKGVAIRETRIRVVPIPSEHSHQFGPSSFGPLAGPFGVKPVTLWRGEALEPADRLPASAGGYPAGRTHAYIIDFLEPSGDDVAFRVYYQDSPTRGPIGFPCRCLNKVNLAILCVGGSDGLRQFPADVVRWLEPDYVMGTHWEDFFNPREMPVAETPGGVNEKIAALPGLDPDDFLDKTVGVLPRTSRALVPCPDSVSYFVRDGRSWRLQGPDAGAWKAGLGEPWDRQAPPSPVPPCTCCPRTAP